MWPFNSKPVLDPELVEYSKQAVKQNEAPPAPPPVKQLKREVAVKTKSLNQIAMDNCVEYEQVYSKCLRSGSYTDRFTGCQSQQQMHDKCVELQAEALEMLGYASAATNESRSQIKAKADDLMIANIPSLTITDVQVENFRRQLGKRD